MSSFTREDEYLEIMVSMSEKTDGEICAIAESGRMDNIIAGYLVLLLRKAGLNMQEIAKLDLDSLFRSISAAEAQMLGKLYKRRL